MGHHQDSRREVWTTYGVTGAGAVAANVDTGVQYNHPALVNQYRGNLGGGVLRPQLQLVQSGAQRDLPRSQRAL